MELLKAVVGSQAYGLATEHSDTDYLGVFLAPTSEILGLSWNDHKATRVHHDPDYTSHELAKFLRLCMGANPTVLELLFVESYETCRMGEQEIRLLRKAVMSDRVRQSYVGYATAQMRKLLDRGGTFSADTAKRTSKHGRHLARLMVQCRQLLLTGTLTLRLSDEVAQECFEAGALAATDPVSLSSWFAQMKEEIDSIDSVLPSSPDLKAIENVLISYRRRHW